MCELPPGDAALRPGVRHTADLVIKETVQPCETVNFICILSAVSLDNNIVTRCATSRGKQLGGTLGQDALILSSSSCLCRLSGSPEATPQRAVCRGWRPAAAPWTPAPRFENAAAGGGRRRRRSASRLLLVCFLKRTCTYKDSGRNPFQDLTTPDSVLEGTQLSSIKT